MNKKLLYIVCVVTVILEVVVLKIMHLGHGYFEFEEIPAFGALIGFFGALLIVIVAKSLSKIITKREDYYD
ncbi:MAG: hypothetical protein N3A59_04660 [Thermodesulfovibrionales bacterium]|nr:hypothetical protein [Thermodesulfovibrionales bacterium]